MLFVTILRKKSRSCPCVLAILLGFVSPGQAKAAIFVANNVTDLLQAINTANSNNQDDIIILAGNATYTLVSVNNIDQYHGANGLPVIQPDNGHSITISGNGSTIRRNTVGSPPPEFRIMQVASGAVIQLNTLTMTAGVATTSDGGGAIYSAGTLKLNGCVLSGNTAVGPFNSSSDGGAIYNYVGTLIATDCTFSNNSTTGGAPADGTAISGGSALGGAIYTATTLTNCTFTNNSCTGGRGATANNGFISGDGGFAEGGAVYGPDSVTNCIFSNNSSHGGVGGAAAASHGQAGKSGNAAGGALITFGTSAIVDSSFNSNSATGATSSGQGAGVGEGGALGIFGDATVTGCTFTSNSATAPVYGSGGAIFALYYNSNVQIRNCTLAMNSATYLGGGICGDTPIGPGSYLVKVNIYNCTFSGNNAPLGGGVYSNSNAEFFYANTIFKLGSSGGNVEGGSLTSQGHNITDDNGGFIGEFFKGPGDMTNTNPQLLTTTPGDYGGPTKTIPIGIFGSSPAINAADPTYAGRRDQRGYFRNAAPDIGAYEYFGSVIGNVTAIARTGLSLTDITVSFEAVDRLNYRLQRKLNITDSNWQDINGVSELTATSNDIEPITAPSDLGLRKAFYRVTFVSGP